MIEMMVCYACQGDLGTFGGRKVAA